jgi:hypothetical protein
VGNADALTTCPQADQKSAADRTLGGLIKDNQQTVFQLNRRQNGPASRGHFRPLCNSRGDWFSFASFSNRKASFELVVIPSIANQTVADPFGIKLG